MPKKNPKKSLPKVHGAIGNGAFVTGSFVYGKPTEKSDVDLAIRVDSETADFLRRMSENGKEPVRFGNLNLILCETDEQYLAWAVGTLEMRESEESYSTFEAKDVLDSYRVKFGVEDLAQSK